MKSKTLLLALIASLVLANGNIVVVNYFLCQWAPCKDRLVCGFGRWDPETPWENIQAQLTLDNSETVRCDQSSYTKTEIHCIYEGLRETKFVNIEHHIFKLRLETAKEVQTREFNQSLAQMKGKERVEGSWTFTKGDSFCNNYFYLDYEPSKVLTDAFGWSTAPELLTYGFCHYPDTAELHIYWQPRKLRNSMIDAKGKQAAIVLKLFGIFRNWDPTHPSNVTICAENLAGNSVKCSYLDVPILSNAHLRQPQDVYYDYNTDQLTWSPPSEKGQLNGYIVYWCLVSSTNPSDCDDNRRIHSQPLDRSKNMLPFKKSLERYHTALVATYRDGISGGMKWSVPKPILQNRTKYLVVTIGSTMLIMFAFIILSWTVLQKVRYMANIHVSLPDFQPKLMRTISFTKPYEDVPIQGHFSPKAMGITIEKAAEEFLPQTKYGETVRSSNPTPHRRPSLMSDNHDFALPAPSSIIENSLELVGYTQLIATKKTPLDENPYVAPPFPS